MIASKRFVMVGSGENVKSVPYMDKPDLTTRQLVGFVRARLWKPVRRRVAIPGAFESTLAFEFLRRREVGAEAGPLFDSEKPLRIKASLRFPATACAIFRS